MVDWNFSRMLQSIDVQKYRTIQVIPLNVVRSRLARQHRGTRPWTRPSFPRDIALGTRSCWALQHYNLNGGVSTPTSF